MRSLHRKLNLLLSLEPEGMGAQCCGRTRAACRRLGGSPPPVPETEDALVSYTCASSSGPASAASFLQSASDALFKRERRTPGYRRVVTPNQVHVCFISLFLSFSLLCFVSCINKSVSAPLAGPHRPGQPPALQRRPSFEEHEAEYFL